MDAGVNPRHISHALTVTESSENPTQHAVINSEIFHMKICIHTWM